MSDLVRVLRGQRIDGRGADEIMRLAADEIESLRARLAEAEKDVTRSRREWQRECEDTNLLLQGMGLCPSEYRSECGSLLLARIRHKMGHIGLRLDETLARLAEAEALLRDSDAAYEQRRFGKWMQDVAVFLGKAPDSADAAPFPRAVKCDRCGLWLAPLAAHECPSDQP